MLPIGPPPQTVTPADPLGPLAALPAVVTAVAGVRTAVDRLLSHRVMRRRSASVTAESSLRGARASASLDGAPVELDVLRESLRSGEPLTGEHRAAIEGAVRVQAGIGGLLDVFERAPVQALARLHVLAAKGLVDDDHLGRPREGSEAADPLRLGAAPSPDEVSHRLSQLSTVLAVTRAPALVVAAVVHGELLVLRPFGSADGVVARAAARMVLISRGLDPKAVGAPEVGHVELRETYAECARGYAGGDVVAWLTHCGQAVELGAREGTAVCEAIQRGA